MQIWMKGKVQSNKYLMAHILILLKIFKLINDLHFQNIVITEESEVLFWNLRPNICIQVVEL